jgi:hypothetical protein
MEERQLTEKESLDLITKMIQSTREKVVRNAGTPLLVWGYSTVIISVAVWYMVSTTGNYLWNLLWFLMGISGLCYGYSLRRQKQVKTHTYIDRVLSTVWWVLGITTMVMSVVTFLAKVPILFVVLLLIGVGITISGFLIRCVAMIIGGILGTLSSLLFLWVTGVDMYLAFAVAFVLLCVIPGHILNYETRHVHV